MNSPRRTFSRTFGRAALASVAVALLGAAALPSTAFAQPHNGAVVVQTRPQVQPQRYGPPPPPRAERVPAPRRGYVWAPGHWEWRGNHHEWVRGNWLRARPGYVYAQPTWQDQGGRWVYNPGRWDRDHDGVPNRHDRRPNDPHRR